MRPATKTILILAIAVGGSYFPPLTKIADIAIADAREIVAEKQARVMDGNLDPDKENAKKETVEAKNHDPRIDGGPGKHDETNGHIPIVPYIKPPEPVDKSKLEEQAREKFTSAMLALTKDKNNAWAAAAWTRDHAKDKDAAIATFLEMMNAVNEWAKETRLALIAEYREELAAIRNLTISDGKDGPTTSPVKPAEPLNDPKTEPVSITDATDKAFNTAVNDAINALLKARKDATEALFSSTSPDKSASYDKAMLKSINAFDRAMTKAIAKHKADLSRIIKRKGKKIPVTISSTPLDPNAPIQPCREIDGKMVC